MAKRRNVLLTTLEGATLRELVREQVSSAWAAVKVGGKQGEDAGRLLGGVYPDTIEVSSWPPETAGLRETVYPSLVAAGEMAPGPGWEHELRVAIEVELTPKTDLSGKVSNHDAAMLLGWWHACVWITDDPGVAERLRRSLMRIEGPAPGHYTAHTGDVGVSDARPAVVPSTWGWVAAGQDHSGKHHP